MTDRSIQFAKPPAQRPRVIIGAGVVGLGIAWRLAARGAAVEVFDRGAAGAGASHAAAGMLAACAEAEPGEEALVALGRESQARWPGICRRVARGLRRRRRAAHRGHAGGGAHRRRPGAAASSSRVPAQLGLPLEWISAAETRRREPHLAASSPARCGARRIIRSTTASLRRPCASPPSRPARASASTAGGKEIAVTAGRADGVVLADGTQGRGRRRRARGRRLVARHRRIAARAAAAGAADQGPDAGAAHGPGGAAAIEHVLWAPGVYLVPRRDGRLLLGATVEEKGFDTTLTAGGVLTLLEAAWRAVPAIEELPIDEMWVGHRPGSRDDAPILGPGPVDGPGLRHRPSSQRHPARAGDRRRDRRGWCSTASSIRRSAVRRSSGSRRRGRRSRERR